MDLKRIKELMSAMGKSNTRKLRLKEKDFEIELEMESQYSEKTFIYSPAEQRPMLKQERDIPPSLNAPLPHHEKPAQEISGNYVTSPMVGTFYATPGPDEPAFVKVGDVVTPQTVVCIIEAMKVMNEVKAGVSGTVSQVLVESGHPVEFGSKLFLVS